MLAWLQFIVSAICIGAGLIIILLSVLGVYRFRFVLNRMHAAAMGDTLGILFIILGLMVANGFNMALLKFLCLIVFMWIASPVSSHLITKLEYLTNENLSRFCRFEHRENPACPEEAEEAPNEQKAEASQAEKKEETHGSR